MQIQVEPQNIDRSVFILWLNLTPHHLLSNHFHSVNTTTLSQSNAKREQFIIVIEIALFQRLNKAIIYC